MGTASTVPHRPSSRSPSSRRRSMPPWLLHGRSTTSRSSACPANLGRCRPLPVASRQDRLLLRLEPQAHRRQARDLVRFRRAMAAIRHSGCKNSLRMLVPQLVGAAPRLLRLTELGVDEVDLSAHWPTASLHRMHHLNRQLGCCLEHLSRARRKIQVRKIWRCRLLRVRAT